MLHSVCPSVDALLWVGTPTSRSTSPTLISWRRKSSARKLSSANCFLLLIWPRSGRDSENSASIHKSNSTETEPVKLVGAQSQQVRQLPDAGEQVSAEHLDRNVLLVRLQIQLDGLRRAGKIVHHQHFVLAKAAHVGEHAVV